jgi:hypothetical protein
MNTNQEMEQRLWEYIDGAGSADERSLIERLLETDLAFRARYQELLQLNKVLSDAELEEPSMRFTRNVMDEIAKYGVAKATSQYINKRIIWAIAGFFFLVIGSMLVYGLSEINWKSSGGTSTLPFGIDSIKFDKWEPSKIIKNTYVNVFMMVNIVLGLYLLDRYLARKRNKRLEDMNEAI